MDECAHGGKGPDNCQLVNRGEHLTPPFRPMCYVLHVHTTFGLINGEDGCDSSLSLYPLPKTVTRYNLYP